MDSATILPEKQMPLRLTSQPREASADWWRDGPQRILIFRDDVPGLAPWLAGVPNARVPAAVRGAEYALVSSLAAVEVVGIPRPTAVSGEEATLLYDLFCWIDTGWTIVGLDHQGEPWWCIRGWRFESDRAARAGVFIGPAEQLCQGRKVNGG